MTRRANIGSIPRRLRPSHILGRPTVIIDYSPAAIRRHLLNGRAGLPTKPGPRAIVFNNRQNHTRAERELIRKEALT